MNQFDASKMTSGESTAPRNDSEKSHLVYKKMRKCFLGLVEVRVPLEMKGGSFVPTSEYEKQQVGIAEKERAILTGSFMNKRRNSVSEPTIKKGATRPPIG